MKKRKIMICAAFAAAVLLSGCKPDEQPPHIGEIPQQSEPSSVQSAEELSAEEYEDILPLSAAVYPRLSVYPLEENYTDDKGYVDSDAYMEAYNKYSGDLKELRKNSDQIDRISYDFYRDSMQQYLSAADGENIAFSPVNMYMALSMLAETAGSDSRQQILTALGEDMDTARSNANALWRQCYNSTPLCTQRLANSLWLSDGMEYNSDTMKALAENYYASVYSGEMGSEELNAAHRKWLNEQTGGMLSEHTQDVGFTADTLMGLSSTVYYQAQWVDEFRNIKEGVFHAPDGELQAEFLKRTYDNKYVYCGENYFALTEYLEGGAVMYFILPDEDISAEELACDEEMYRMLDDPESTEKRLLEVHLSVPKFDVSAQLDLAEGMKQLGITDIFSGDTADFTPLANIDGNIWIDKAEHAVRVTMDEKGCTAAAYINIDYCGDALPQEVEELYLTFDRPFIFVIQQSGQPLFCGIVNRV